MYYYNIVCSYYEDGDSSITLFHRKKYSQKEFSDLVSKAIKEVRLSSDGTIETWDQMCDYAVEHLCKYYGFQQVRYTAEYDEWYRKKVSKL